MKHTKAMTSMALTFKNDFFLYIFFICILIFTIRKLNAINALHI